MAKTPARVQAKAALSATETALQPLVEMAPQHMASGAVSAVSPGANGAEAGSGEHGEQGQAAAENAVQNGRGSAEKGESGTGSDSAAATADSGNIAAAAKSGTLSGADPLSAHAGTITPPAFTSAFRSAVQTLPALPSAAVVPAQPLPGTPHSPDLASSYKLRRRRSRTPAPVLEPKPQTASAELPTYQPFPPAPKLVELPVMSLDPLYSSPPSSAPDTFAMETVRVDQQPQGEQAASVAPSQWSMTRDAREVQESSWPADLPILLTMLLAALGAYGLVRWSSVKCPRCGKLLEAGSFGCLNCGVRLSPRAIVVTTHPKQ